MNGSRVAFFSIKRFLAAAPLTGLLVFLPLGGPGVALAARHAVVAGHVSLPAAAHAGSPLASRASVRRPTISGFSPASGAVGTRVAISGTSFTGARSVTFNGTAASYTVTSSTRITATVPAAASSGPIRVTTAGGTATSSSRFAVTTTSSAPTLSSFSPTSGAVGTPVTISGTNFTGATAVAFNGAAASYTVASATQISATVPAGAASGRISVTTPHGTATSSGTFSVTAAGPRTVTSGAFNVQWSPSDPEEITSFSWNGSPNLTNTWTNPGQCPGNPDFEFFGNAWGPGAAGVHPILVGGGTTGTWNSQTLTGSTAVTIASAGTGCPPQTRGIPVATNYQFPSTGNAFTVQRKFSFGATPFKSDLKPYIARFFPGNQYTNVYYPTTAGTLGQANEGGCFGGCAYTDWNGSWFAMTSWATGQAVIVKRTSPAAPLSLWVEQDGGSGTSTASVLLQQPAAGFTGTVTEAESMCFSGNWNPGLTLPAGC